MAAAEREDVYAGCLLQEVSVLRDAGQPAAAQEAFDEFARRVPADVAAAPTAPPQAPRRPPHCARRPDGVRFARRSILRHHLWV